ncbi:hypothetical protein C8D87_111239 [Lentzea atacamensis]|uniref:Uncharacterized protein n=1 Tax=Lentzea atacamensis TaxID=531938 RepID=A0ABX9DYQ3_9PSEU|nr:hypothetical protein [Lentzea atacamensis]RAS60820.1 hypothetical protein C8D87_111239 [Lentzea atacamensis]
MWAVIGVWKLNLEMHDEWRAQVPLMASSKVWLPGFVHGTRTQDGHAIQVYDN